jgi:phage terminase large subunit-like protein
MENPGRSWQSETVAGVRFVRQNGTKFSFSAGLTREEAGKNPSRDYKVEWTIPLR